MNARQSYFSLLLTKSTNPVGICTSVLLAWMAHADGNFSQLERDILAASVQRLLPDWNEGRRQAVLEELVAIAREGKTSDIALACTYIRRLLPVEERELFLDLFIGMMVSDNRVSLAERYILECIADVIGVLPDQLNERYKQNTGKYLGQKADPGSRIWWEVHAKRASGTGNAGSKRSHSLSGTSEKEQAFAALGLTPGCSKDDIRTAYRRLALQHHPDRFQALGEEAVQRATMTFVRLKAAHDTLMQS